MEKKYIIIIFVFLILTATVYNMFLETPSLDLDGMIDSENPDDLSLTIYYISPSVFTFFPVTIEDMIDGQEHLKTVINCNDLTEHISTFQQIRSTDLIPAWRKTPCQHVRLYYVLKSSKNGKLFDVAWCIRDDKSVFVNGYKVKEKEIFYDAIKPFMPDDDTAREIEKWIGRGNCGFRKHPDTDSGNIRTLIPE